MTIVEKQTSTHICGHKGALVAKIPIWKPEFQGLILVAAKRWSYVAGISLLFEARPKF